MDQIVHRVLRFDRFALDLSRGCLRADDGNIDLRPKAFEVLRVLAENAGRLVSKDELYQAVWPNLAVSDDSLSQCIHELRQKLGDTEHRLIKTVARRGYLLDPVTVAPDALPGLQELSQQRTEDHRLDAAHVDRRHTSRKLAGITALVVLASLGVYWVGPGLVSSAHSTLGPLAKLFPQPAASELFTAADARRIAALAEIKQLPIPAFRISKPSPGIPEDARRFVGVWVSGSGWLNSNRQFMLIVTRVSPDGVVEGYTADGPPMPKSSTQDTARASAIKAQLSGDTFYFSGRNGQFAASLTAQNRIEFKLKFRDGHVGVVALDPAWTLVAAERAAERQTMHQ
jgi:DNA-binding winged helix-turn-helix (wHTH) protein